MIDDKNQTHAAILPKEDTCSRELSEVEYYMENGYVVFTEAYHLKRGHCCKNSCRHCPYGYRKKQ